MKKLISLLLVLCLIFSMIPAAFAAETDYDYVAIGDDVTLGANLEDTSKTFVGLLSTEWAVDGNNLGYESATSADLLEYLNGDEADASIKTAKRITLNIGMYDFLAPAFEYACEVLELNSEEYDEESFLSYFDSMDYLTFLQFAVNFQTKLKSDEAVTALTQAATDFSTNFKAIVEKIYELNPDVDLVVYDIYNPFAGITYNQALLTSIVSTSSIDFATIGSKYVKLMNETINEEGHKYTVISLYGFNTASNGMTGVKLPESVDLLTLLMSGDFTSETDFSTIDFSQYGVDTDYSIDPRPSEAGHQEIATRTIAKRPTIEVPEKLTVTFETNGGTAVDPISVEYGDTVDLTKYTTTKEGYNFTGWYSTSKLTKTITSVTVNANKTIYAGWARITYALSFNTNGGSELTAVDIEEGTEVDLSAYVPTLEGKVFDGWYSDEALTKPVTKVTMTAATTIYAKWRDPGAFYTVTFNTNGGTEITAVSAEEGTVIDLSKYTTTRDGFEFDSWYSDAALKTKATSVTVSADTTVYAGWTEIFELSFVTNGGTELKTKSFTDGSTVDLDKYVTTLVGYEFIGWCTDEELTNVVTTFVITADTTVYAKWENPDPFKNFVKKYTYTRGYFDDVDETEWYGFDNEKVIEACYNYGLMDGTDYYKFNPTGKLTIAEAITLACRLHSIYNGGTGEFTQGEPWYQVYVNYAIENSIIGKYDFDDYEADATRAQMAYIFYNALGEEGYEAIRTVETIPDVAKTAKYADEIYLLYNAGVLSGNDDAGTFTPDEPIERCAAAAIIARAAKIVERQSYAIPITNTEAFYG